MLFHEEATPKATVTTNYRYYGLMLYSPMREESSVMLLLLRFNLFRLEIMYTGSGTKHFKTITNPITYVAMADKFIHHGQLHVHHWLFVHHQ